MGELGRFERPLLSYRAQHTPLLLGELVLTKRWADVAHDGVPGAGQRHWQRKGKALSGPGVRT